MKTKQQAAWLLLIGVAALLIRLAPLVRHDMTFQTGWDAADYIPLANGIEYGCGFARLVNGHCGNPSVSRPPGYPYFIALMPNLRTVLVGQAILGATLCVWLGWFVSERWGIKAGLLAEALLATDIPTIVYGAMIMSEALFQFLLTGAVLLQLSAIMAKEWSWRATAKTISAAVILAAAAMIRSTGIFLPLFAPLPFLFMKNATWTRALTLASLALAITLAPMLAWIARNRSVGVNIPSSDSAVTLYYYGAAGVLAYATHRPFNEVSVELARQARYQGAHGMIRHSLEIYATHPIAALIVTVRGLVLVAIVPDRNELNEMIGTNGGGPLGLPPSFDIMRRIQATMRSPTLTALVLLQLALLGFVWAGIARNLSYTDWTPNKNAACVLIPLGAVVLMLACAVGPAAHARFRVPAVPFLAMLAAIGWLGVRGDAAALGEGGFVHRITTDGSIV